MTNPFGLTLDHRTNSQTFRLLLRQRQTPIECLILTMIQRVLSYVDSYQRRTNKWAAGWGILLQGGEFFSNIFFCEVLAILAIYCLKTAQKFLPNPLQGGEGIPPLSDSYNIIISTVQPFVVYHHIALL